LDGPIRFLTRDLPLNGRQAVDLLAAVAGEPYPWLLETLGQPGPSFVGSRPEWVLRGSGAGALEQARARLARQPVADHRSDLGFRGGLVCLLGYDMGRCFEELPCTTEDDLGLPECVLLETSYVVRVDEAAGIATVIVPADAERNLDRLCRLFSSAPARARPVVPRSGPLTLPCASTYTRDEYHAMVGRVKDYIAAGDIIQANISQRLCAHVSVDALALYEHLRVVNPSPMAFYVDCGDFQLASCSPERLLEVRGREVQTRPIAGTRPRGGSETEDRALRSELILSKKERAEHIMLVDLERNDLGRVCEYGSVEANELMVLESYSHVSHIVSNVRGRLRPDCDAFDAIAATFPGGTITGCPKIRCMEIIDEVEKTRRGPYTGSFGYIDYDGDMDLNIIIRTFVVKEGAAYVQVGGGIVADSEPDAEYRETLHKAEALLRAAEVAMRG